MTDKHDPGEYIEEARKIDKLWLGMNLFSWLLMFIGGVLLATLIYQGFIAELIQTRPYTIYLIPFGLVTLGFILQRLATKRAEKLESKGGGTGGRGGYK